MLLYMYEHNLLIYAICILFGVGLLTKLVLTITYFRLMRAAKDMGASENKLMKLIRLRFDTCYKIKLGVHNVDSFVDKYVYSHKFCGITLYTWENISGQINMITLLLGLFGGGLALFLKCGQDVILFTFAVGASAVVLLIAFEELFSLNAKKKMLRIHMKDYLENNLKAKLENEYFLTNEMEDYRNDYFKNKKEDEEEEEEAVPLAKQKIKNSVETLTEKEEDEKIIEEILKEYLI